MDTVLSYSDHGVMICTRTDRTGLPRTQTRLRMRGFIAGMTAEQIQAALAYDGPINHGDTAFLRRDNDGGDAA